MSTGAYSPSKALAWPDRLQTLREGGQPYPVHVQIILSDLCNLDCPQCFIPGTLVATPDGDRPIERIGIGDMVIGHDGEAHRVLDTSRREYIGPLVLIRLTDGIKLRCTPEHPIYVAGPWPSNQFEWRPAKDISAGDLIRERIGPGDWESRVVVETITGSDAAMYHGRVYNLEVEGSHSYIANGIVVHNCAYRLSGYSSNQLFNVQNPDGTFNHNPNRMLDPDLVKSIIDDCEVMDTRAIQFSVSGDELLPIIGPDGVVKVRPIGEFVDTIFDKPNSNGAHQEKSICGAGFKSYAIDDDGKIVVGEIEAVYRHQAVEPLYEVILEDGRGIRVTGSHSLNAIRDGRISKVPVTQLKTGDLVACAIWRTVPELPKRLEVPKEDHPNAKQINDYVVPSAELFRLLGYYTAEGSRVSNSLQWCFGTGPREDGYRKDALDCVQKVFGVPGAFVDDASGRPNRVALHSKRGWMFFEALGALGVQIERRIPDIVWSAPDEWKIQYLIGLFSGDGYFRATTDSRGFKRNAMHVTTCNRGLAHEVLALLHQLGVPATLTGEKNKVRFVGSRRIEPSDKFTVNVYAAEGLEILAPVVEALGAAPVYRANSPHSTRGSRRKFESFGAEASALRIKSIKRLDELGRPMVYDITVAGTHRFLTVAGIGASNTGGGEPTIHPKARELIAYAQERGLDTALVTNGLNLERRIGEAVAMNLSWLRISVDAAAPDTFAKVRPAYKGDVERSKKNFENVIESIRWAVERKRATGSPIVIGMGFVTQEENWRELADFVRLARDLGVDNVRISGAFTPKGDAYHAGYREEALALEKEAAALATPSFAVHARFAEKLDDLQARPDYKDCWYQQFTTYIGGDANLYRCCVQAYNRHGLIGNVKDAGGFKALWDSKLKEFKFAKFDARSCAMCQFSDRNRSIDAAVRSPDPLPPPGDVVHKSFV